MPTPTRLQSLFETELRNAPDHPALLCGIRALSYRELDNYVRRVVAALIARGNGVGE